MQISHIFTELGTGLKRNVSMTVSVVVTTFVSLTLVGFGLLVNSQASQTEEFFGDRLTVQVVLCSESSTTGSCINGAATDSQRADIEAALEENPEVKSVRYQTSQEAYDKAKELFSQSPSGERAFEFTSPDRFPASYFVVLNDPQEFEGVLSQMTGTAGVEGVLNLSDYLKPLYLALDYMQWAALGVAGLLVLAAVLQVSNTIRLTAYARRREIGIMRLVGASSWHIQLPFILESLIASVFAGLLACGALAAFMQLGIKKGILEVEGLARITTWVGWEETAVAGGLTLGLAILLGLLPPLLLTRKYLDV
jgi:cell division transport system permease protein